ncbi:MAG: type II secretion system F family protein [Bacillota bacterium]|nr:type II secretion system F family protein [Bacillota bacterium]
MTAPWVSMVVFLAVLGADLLLRTTPGRLAGRLGEPAVRKPLSCPGRLRTVLLSWRDRRAIEAQLGRLAEILAGAVGVGMSVPGALEHAVRQVSGPLRGELEQVLREYHLGISLSGALRSWKMRAGSRDVDLLVDTLELVRQVGGSMSAPLAQVAATLERRRRDRQDAWAQGAEARLSAAVVASVPPLVMIATARSQSETWRVVAETSAGQLALGFAVMTWLLGVAVTLFLLRPPR